MIDRLFANWAYATPPVALLLIGLYPFIGSAIAFPLFLSLPAYMIHQYEEHDNNRFAVFMNGIIGTGRKGLSSADIWIVNVIFVWFLLLATFHIASVYPGMGVLAAYLLAINGFIHVAWAIKFRQYNPGLLTSIVLFLPLATWIFAAIPATLAVHLGSAVLVILLHAAIIFAARRPA